MKKILLIMLMCLTVFSAKSENLKKLSEKKRNEKLIKIAKKTALEYGDSRYWVDGADYKIEILTPNPENPLSAKEKYRITFTNEFAKNNMEYGHLVSVDIETETGRAVYVSYGNGWGVPVKDKKAKTKSSKPIKKMSYQTRKNLN